MHIWQIHKPHFTPVKTSVDNHPALFVYILIVDYSTLDIPTFKWYNVFPNLPRTWKSAIFHPVEWRHYFNKAFYQSFVRVAQSPHPIEPRETKTFIVELFLRENFYQSRDFHTSHVSVHGQPGTKCHLSLINMLQSKRA